MQSNKAKIGIVGLGLIGGSLAAALHDAGYAVFGCDKEKSIQDFAEVAGTIDGKLDEKTISECDVVFIAITLEQAKNWIVENAEYINKDALVIDCCGVKREICKVGEEAAAANGFTFMGGHPMAGKQVGGYKNSRADLFRDAAFCLVPSDKNDIRLMMKAKTVLADAGFSKFIVMTPDEHDRVIAFTSQLAHLISNAYIKSDIAEADEVAMLSGGAFRDMTRVAYLDEAMWTELFLQNGDNLLSELNDFIEELERYKVALENKNSDALAKLLIEGKERKQKIEGK
ncbi:MAG: prephenate dehydrogenase/arogenate dehydrogenase family protein [Firmicutes bacterium]|nr:prephenate dehydrogenase/arogenate dehydrogenase family protein [Bacillota bacterium]